MLKVDYEKFLDWKNDEWEQNQSCWFCEVVEDEDIFFNHKEEVLCNRLKQYEVGINITSVQETLESVEDPIDYVLSGATLDKLWEMFESGIVEKV